MDVFGTSGDASCSTQPARGMFSSKYAAASAAAAMPLVIFFFLPWLWRAVGAGFGWYLRRKTEGRRHQVIEIMEVDERRFAQEEAPDTKRSSSDDDWETVDGYTTGTADNGAKGQKEWDGIVGFFHPFWFVIPWGASCVGI